MKSRSEVVEQRSERAYYSVSQAATLLGVSRVSIWRWVRAGRIPIARLGHRTTRIKREDLERLRLERDDRGPRAGPEQSSWLQVGPGEHVAQFYEADDFLLEGLTELIAVSLRHGEAGIVVASQAHRAELLARLGANGIDVAGAAREGRFVALDAAETLALFMQDGMPRPDAFASVIGPLVDAAGSGGRPVHVYGEMVGLLAAEGNHAAAIQLETLWNTLQKTHAFSLFCGYPMADFATEPLGEALRGVCAEHSRVLPAESYASVASVDERLRSITVLQQKARSLESALEAERQARSAAEDALRLRDEFLSIASHELRTPITSLSAYAQLALRRFKRDGLIDPERVEQALQTINGQAERLARLLGQLLDISRLEGGRYTLEPEMVDVSRLVQQMAEAAQGWTDQHLVQVSAPASLEALVDPLRFEQVVVNLLDNAIKYSPDGGPIEVTLRQPAPRTLELAVRDHGLGIPPDMREHIFERFYQAHRSAHKSGMGLGLYISRHIVELHGGSIRAEFPTDGGTRLVVSLPVWTASSSPSAA